MDLDLIVRSWPLIWNAYQLTIVLAAAILVISTIAGFLLALARQSGSRILAWLVAAYVNVFRAVPVLVVLYFTFYGLPQVGMPLTPVTAALLGICLASTAYLCEDMRSGLLAIDRGQYQAAKALGLGYWRTTLRIILPQAFRVMLAPYMTRAIIIVKATSLASIVAVTELTGQVYALVSSTYRAWEFLLVAATLYLALNAVLALVQVMAERRFALKQ